MFWEIIIKTAIVHTFTYFLVGFSAFTLFRYASTTLSHPRSNMRPATDLRVRAGVLFQPIRGILFGFVFFLLKDIVFQQANGWLILWLMLVIVGILSTFAPAASSIEGVIYLKSGIGTNWGGLVEILIQSFLLSVITFYWVNHADLAILNWVCGIVFAAAILFTCLGLFAAQKGTKGSQEVKA
jgi:hypothetical protein